MKTKIRLVLAVAVASVVASSAIADTKSKSHRQAAEDLLKISGVEGQMERSIEQSIEMQAKANPQIAPFKDVMKKFLAKHMSYASLKEELIDTYTDAFTEKELKEITAFYKTPIGKKMIEKMPELMSKSMQLGATRVQDNQAELIQMIQAEAAKPKK